jgi:DNA-binding PadR family transcriptional regulator
VAYQTRPTRNEYHLTPKGRAFFDVLAAMWRWGEDWLFSERGAPVALVDRETGEDVHPLVVDERTGRRIELPRLRVRIRKRPPRVPEGGSTAS